MTATQAARQARRRNGDGRVSIKANLTPRSAAAVRDMATRHGISESAALARLVSEALGGESRTRVISALRLLRDRDPALRREVAVTLLADAPPADVDRVLGEAERMGPNEFADSFHDQTVVLGSSRDACRRWLITDAKLTAAEADEHLANYEAAFRDVQTRLVAHRDAGREVEVTLNPDARMSACYGPRVMADALTELSRLDEVAERQARHEQAMIEHLAIAIRDHRTRRDAVTTRDASIGAVALDTFRNGDLNALFQANLTMPTIRALCAKAWELAVNEGWQPRPRASQARANRALARLTGEA